MTLCQFCLDRQLPEPGEAIGIYQKRPICDLCLGVFMDNLNATQTIDGIEKSSLNSRKETALKILDQFEELLAGWELSEHEVLLSRDDFFNHKPPALINLTVDQIKQQISYRKAVLFTFKIKDERWTKLIDDIRSQERREQGLVSVTKSIKETTKKSKIGKDAKSKMAKLFGVSVEQLEAFGAEARAKEFAGITKGQEQLSSWEKPKNEVRNTLEDLQKQISAQTTVSEVKKVSRCEVCRKLTCVCRVK